MFCRWWTGACGSSLVLYKRKEHKTHIPKLSVWIPLSRYLCTWKEIFLEINTRPRTMFLVTHADVVMAVGHLSAMYACVHICQHSKTKTTGHTITKLGRWTVHGKSWSPVLFEIKRSNVKVSMSLHFSEWQPSKYVLYSRNLAKKLTQSGCYVITIIKLNKHVCVCTFDTRARPKAKQKHWQMIST